MVIFISDMNLYAIFLFLRLQACAFFSIATLVASWFYHSICYLRFSQRAPSACVLFHHLKPSSLVFKVLDYVLQGVPVVVVNLVVDGVAFLLGFLVFPPACTFLLCQNWPWHQMISLVKLVNMHLFYVIIFIAIGWS